MEKIIKNNNVTEYYINNELSLAITKLKEDKFKVENNFNIMIGYCKNIDKYKTAVRLEELYTKGKNGRLYKTKKLFEHNIGWFSYILQEKGFVLKAEPIKLTLRITSYQL